MTLTSAEVAKLQKHNADLVKENATLTRDNAELRRQISAIKQWAIIRRGNFPTTVCKVCKYCDSDSNSEPCVSCDSIDGSPDWEPPDAPPSAEN